ncbi:MAG: transcription/translation regulatory transformer protein RfaH [Arenicellales bacterium]
MEAASKKCWYLLTAKANQDQRAQDNLLNQGYTVYRPLARVPRIRRGKREYRIESLFPRYLFIQLDPQQDNWSPIRSTYGVSGFVKFGMYPSAVPDSLIDYVREHEQEFESRAIVIDEFQKNEPIAVMDGAFKGLEGVFMQFEGKQRALVLLHFLGHQRPMRVPTRVLKSI